MSFAAIVGHCLTLLFWFFMGGVLFVCFLSERSVWDLFGPSPFWMISCNWLMILILYYLQLFQDMVLLLPSEVKKIKFHVGLALTWWVAVVENAHNHKHFSPPSESLAATFFHTLSSIFDIKWRYVLFCFTFDT